MLYDQQINANKAFGNASLAIKAVLIMRLSLSYPIAEGAVVRSIQFKRATSKR